MTAFSSARLRRGMLMKYLACVALLGLGTIATACNDTPVGITTGPAHVRIVNSAYQTTDDANTPSTAVPRAIDFLLDSSTTSPSALGIPGNSVFPVQTDGDGYQELSQGLHTFLARFATPATPTTSLFTNGADPLGEFLPKLFFTGDTYYTIIISGVAPQTGLPDADAFLPNLGGFNVEYPLLDDNAPPPKDANGQYLSRFRLVNAAPFGPGGSANGAPTMYLYLTQGTTPTAAELPALRISLRADYRMQASSGYPKYANVPAGSYVVTIAEIVGSTRIIVAQQPVMLGAGEIHTMLVQNTAYADQPSTANHVLRVLLDAKY
jgi:hypothetical protein